MCIFSVPGIMLENVFQYNFKIEMKERRREREREDNKYPHRPAEAEDLCSGEYHAGVVCYPTQSKPIY